MQSSSPDDPVNDRSTDDAEAALGLAALVARAAGASAAVADLFGAAGARGVVPIPWQRWSLRREDFMLTRMLEVVVHADDLAVGLGVPTPPFQTRYSGRSGTCWCAWPSAGTVSPR